MSRKKIIVIFILGILLAAFGGALFPLVDYIIEKEIKKKVVISNSSETYDIWQDVPVPVYMQFYIFNVDNVMEIKKGERPAVSQKGPYTYRERRTKFDIVWNENGTVSYKQNRTFHFVPDMSSGDESDLIITVNPLIAVIGHSLQFMPPFLNNLVSLMLSLTPEEDLFMKRPVKEVLWGYEDPALVLLRSLVPSWFQTTVIGYFIRKNFTDDGLYTVYTGATDTDLVGTISKYNGQSTVEVWSTYWANMINGTDGTLSSPLNFDREVAQIFVSDICRSIKGVFKREVTLPQGIKLRQFGGDQRDMLNATVNKDNIGFCTPITQCLPTGLLNSTSCQEPVDSFPLPVIFSFPHFLYADPEVQNSVIGLQPNEEEHQTHIDIEPYTGLVLQVAKRLQINIFIEQVPGISQLNGIRKLYFPVLWINESSVTDDKHADLLLNELFTPMEIADFGKIALLSLGGFFILLAAGLVIYNKSKSPNRVTHENEAAAPCLKARSISYDDPLAHGGPPSADLSISTGHTTEQQREEQQALIEAGSIQTAQQGVQRTLIAIDNDPNITAVAESGPESS